MSLVKLYKNGSYEVQINLDTGSRYYFGNSEHPSFPDSIDLKITQWCPHGCKFCYEGSGNSGKHCDTGKLLKILGNLPKVPLEIALGGGSAPDHPDFLRIKDFIIERGNIANLTINQSDILENRFGSEIYSGISGLGISIGSGLKVNPEDLLVDGPKQHVFHVISGITPVEDIKKLVESSQKVLVLGYKNMGRAKKDSIPEMKDTEMYLKRTFRHCSNTIVFDDLSIKQLNIRAAVIDSVWKMIYQGPEFSHSMFIDAVEGKYYPSSTERDQGTSWDDISISDYFSKNHVKDIN